MESLCQLGISDAIHLFSATDGDFTLVSLQSLYGAINRSTFSITEPLPLIEGLPLSTTLTDRKEVIQLDESCGQGAIWKAYRLSGTTEPGLILKLSVPSTPFDEEYSPKDIRQAIKRDFDLVSGPLKCLEKGGMVPSTRGLYVGKVRRCDCDVEVWGMLMDDGGEAVGQTVDGLMLHQR